DSLTAPNPAPNAVFTMYSEDNWATLKYAGLNGRGNIWYKQKDYTQPAERALAGDCRAYVLEAQSVPNAQSIPGQPFLSGATFWNTGVNGQASYDFYRHGKYPELAGTDIFKAQ